MKFNYISILTFLIFQNIYIFGQESKNNLILSGNLTHFINVEVKKDFTPYPGYFKYPVSPSAELIYSRVISSKFIVGTGINFQLGLVSSYDKEFVQWRFYTYELSVPVILKRVFQLNNGNQQSITSGIYLGKYIKVVGESPDNWNWQKIIEENIPYFSKDTFYGDLYFDWGYIFRRDKKPEYSVSPFFKYRINSTWINHYENKLCYGIKMNLTLKL